MTVKPPSSLWGCKFNNRGHDCWCASHRGGVGLCYAPDPANGGEQMSLKEAL